MAWGIYWFSRFLFPASSDKTRKKPDWYGRGDSGDGDSYDPAAEVGDVRAIIEAAGGRNLGKSSSAARFAVVPGQDHMVSSKAFADYESVRLSVKAVLRTPFLLTINKPWP
jgi:hypothetical protein